MGSSQHKTTIVSFVIDEEEEGEDQDEWVKATKRSKENERWGEGLILLLVWSAAELSPTMHRAAIL